MNLRRSIGILVLSLAVCGLAPAVAAAQDAAAQGEKESAPEWQKEFDEVCSKTQDAMTLATEELSALIARCDALQPRIEKLDETRRKVYLRRLRQCRGLYAYVLESRKNAKK